MEYLNLNKTSKVTKISAKRLQYLCRTKSIKGAKKINNKWYIPKKSIQNLKNSTPKRSLLKIIITVFSIIGGIAAILTIFEFATDHLLSKKISSSFIIPETEPARENELLIIVMDFEKKGNLEYDISGRITEVLVKTLTWIPGSSIRVEQIKEFIPRSEMFVPSTVGAKYGAAILIWGSYDDASIKPSFAIPSTLPYSSLHSKHPTGVKVDPKLSRIANEIGLINKTNIPLRLRNNEFSLGGIGTEFTEFPAIGENRINYINDILPNSMIYLSSLVTGIYYYLNEKMALC